MRLVSIGSTHPLGSAGVAVDARVAEDYGLAFAAAIAGVTAQNGRVAAVHAVPSAVLRAQLSTVTSAAAYRVGALISEENVRTVAAFLRSQQIPIVVDPVLRASGGDPLFFGTSYVAALRDELLSLPLVVTPNLEEASELCDLQVARIDEMIAAGRALRSRGAAAALVTGGHLAGEPADVLVHSGEPVIFRASRLPGEMRGTGCRLAAALACELAQGRDLPGAVELARKYVRSRWMMPHDER